LAPHTTADLDSPAESAAKLPLKCLEQRQIS